MDFSKKDLDELIRIFPGDYAIYIWRDGSLHTLYFSPGLPQLSGMSAEEYRTVTEKDAVDIVAASDRQLVREQLAGLHDFNESTVEEFGNSYRIRHQQKGSTWVQARVRVVGKIDGAPVLMAVFHSSSFGAEEHAVLLQHTIASIYVIDRNTHELLYLNETAKKNFGHGDCAGDVCYHYICGLDRACPWCSLPRMKKGEGGEDEIFMASIGKWLKINCYDMNWFNRQAVAVYAVDITSQKERQRSLEINMESLEKIVQNLPVGVAVCEIRDGKARTLNVNSLILQMLNCRKEDFSSGEDKDILARVYPSDRAALAQTMKRCYLPNVSVRLEYRYRRSEEENYRWYHLEARTIPQRGGLMLFACFTDITTEKEGSIELVKSRRMYQMAATTARLELWEYNPHTRRITMMTESDFTRELCTERSLPRVIENGPETLSRDVIEEDRAGFMEMYNLMDEGAESACCDVRFNTVNGVRYEHLICTRICDEKGLPITVYGIGQDNTEQRQAEEKYLNAYRQLAQAHPYTLGSFHLNLTTNWCGEGQSPLPFVLGQQKSGTVDGYFAEFAKLIADDKIREHFFAVFTREHLLEEFRSGRTKVSIEYPIIYPNGEKYWREGLLFMLRNPRTGDVEAVTYAIDINDRKKNERIIDIITNEEFDYIGLIHPVSGTFEFCNKQPSIRYGKVGERMDYEECCRYVRECFVDKGELRHFDECVSLRSILKNLWINGRCSSSYQRTENGAVSRRHLQYRWLDEPGGDILVVRSNITAAYEQEQERILRIQEALKAAESANRAKTEFLSRISHDIRTPISIISSMTDFAIEDADVPDKLLNDLQKIKSADAFLLSLINDVLDISKIDSGKIELNPEPCSCSGYIADISNMFEPVCQQKSIRFFAEYSGNPVGVLADKIRLNQIALNLLSNAVKYTPEGGKVSFLLHGEALPKNEVRFLMEVEDNGIGMSEDFQKRMFDPFSQEYDNPSRPKAISGTGLGLSIVKRIVDLMGGTLTVESTLGKGTKIRCELVLPAAMPEKSLVEPTTNILPAKLQKLHGKVLLAEDNPVNTEIAERLLSGFGLETASTENGQAAVKRFRSSAPGEFGAILMDLQMPVMNGYEAAQAIREMKRPDASVVPIYLMTTDAFAAAIDRCSSVGMNGHILKPLVPSDLYKVLCAIFPAAGE